ncbi:MAG: C_GCAxxG_C_C family protein [Lachnospira sp.]|nr:C_GCAxxG_C_C family protein [Lachnospira sp.]
MEENEYGTRREKAQAYFKKGYNCSQAVFAAYADLYGLDEETALKLSASFGGGIGRMRSVCGCATAMFMVAGLETGCTDGADQAGKGNNYEVVQHLAEEYKNKAGGSMICSELLGLTPMPNREKEEVQILSAEEKKTAKEAKPSERTQEYYKKRPCVELVGIACDIIEEELLKRK